MENNFYSFNYKANELMAVPAVHFRTAFAEQINKICSDPDHRPDAIVVELGHPLAMELFQFLKELGQGTKKKEILPCMLGILKRNRYINAEMYEKTILLQKFYSKPLYEIPDHILADRLNFNKWSTLYISPTDSIIEAIRCALELEVPLYGVDLTDIAALNPMKHSIEDPNNAFNDVLAYTNRMLKYCDHSRDPRIDLNREIYMASGLKHCLSIHRKVLFTCGIAHWNKLLTLLNDDTILPFPVHEIPIETEFKRAIIHPSIAIYATDTIPQLTFDYEISRVPVSFANKENKKINSAQLIRDCLDDLYKAATNPKDNSNKDVTDSSLWSNIGAYENYLFNLTTVKQRKLPDANLMILAAEVMMTKNFCQLLINRLLKVNPDWISKNEFSDLPVIGPYPKSKSVGSKKNIKVSFKKKAQNGDKKSEDFEESFFTNQPEWVDNIETDIDKHWDWTSQREKEFFAKYFGTHWIWPPCESLTFGLAFKAAEIAYLNQDRFNSYQQFEGSLDGGVNVKATIRSYLKGEKRIYINKLRSSTEQAIIDGTNPDPFVYIFELNPEIANSNWKFYNAGHDVDLYVKNKDYFDKIEKQNGAHFVSSISLENDVISPVKYKDLRIYMSWKKGHVMFGNPCINAKQGAIWLETTDYKCCPILKYCNSNSIIDYYKNRFSLSIDLSIWQESLVRMAIPFAKKMVTIIAPDSYRLPRSVVREAANKRITLHHIGFSNFSEAQLEEARTIITAPSLDTSGLTFSSEIEIALNQHKELYFEMLPLAIRKQVDGFENKDRLIRNR